MGELEGASLVVGLLYGVMLAMLVYNALWSRSRETFFLAATQVSVEC